MSNIVWKSVFSSNVQRLGWQPDPPAMLVEWTSGKNRTSEYAGVDEKLFEEITKAPSVGTALNMEIKGKYAHRYVG